MILFIINDVCDIKLVIVSHIVITCNDYFFYLLYMYLSILFICDFVYGCRLVFHFFEDHNGK